MVTVRTTQYNINPLNAELNPIRHLLALVGDRHIVHVSRIRAKKLCSLSYGVFMYSIWILYFTAIISPNRIFWIVFPVHVECFLSEVGN